MAAGERRTAQGRRNRANVAARAKPGATARAGATGAGADATAAGRADGQDAAGGPDSGAAGGAAAPDGATSPSLEASSEPAAATCAGRERPPPDRGGTLAPGLYFIATPIGAARDITLRALDILATADVLAAEDTRTLRHLMEIHAIPLAGRPLIAYHDHNGAEARPRLLAHLAEGRRLAYASEAGTPLVADPGYQLGRAAIAAGHPVMAAPGPSAVLAALTVSGLPSDRFFFAGFPPATAGARRSALAELAAIPGTVIFYESPKRISRLLGELVETFGRERQAAVCRELTKRFEEVTRGTLGSLAEVFSGRDVRGEIVVLVGRAGAIAVSAAELEARLRLALSGASVKDAAGEVAEALGLPRREVYQTALKLMQGDG